MPSLLAVVVALVVVLVSGCDLNQPPPRETVTAAATLEPSTPASQVRLAIQYWEKAHNDTTLTASEKRACIAKGIAATDRALTIDPEHLDALAYKTVLLSRRITLEPDPAQRAQAIAETSAHLTRAREVRKARRLQGRPLHATLPSPDTIEPVRAGTRFQFPLKVHNVAPISPIEALQAGVAGILILDVTLAIDGSVTDARILKSIPLLDQAALEAVYQWEFEPTIVNGHLVPVVMSTTVNFVLPKKQVGLP